MEADHLDVNNWYIDGAFAVHDNMKIHSGSYMTFGREMMDESSNKQKINTAEPKTPGVPWCSEFFVPNIKHKGTSGILSKLLKPRTSLVFRGVLSPRKIFMS